MASNRIKEEEKREEAVTDRWESVAGVRNKHASFSDGAVTDSDALYEPRRAHLRHQISILFFSLFRQCPWKTAQVLYVHFLPQTSLISKTKREQLSSSTGA